MEKPKTGYGSQRSLDHFMERMKRKGIRWTGVPKERKPRKKSPAMVAGIRRKPE